jgi:hypothetical protein
MQQPSLFSNTLISWYIFNWLSSYPYSNVLTFQRSTMLHPDHLFLDSAPNIGPLISRWEINKFENCRYKSVGILEVLKLLFQQFLNLSSSQRDMSGPILGDLSNNRWSGVIWSPWFFFLHVHFCGHLCPKNKYYKQKKTSGGLFGDCVNEILSLQSQH